MIHPQRPLMTAQDVSDVIKTATLVVAFSFIGELIGFLAVKTFGETETIDIRGATKFATPGPLAFLPQSMSRKDLREQARSLLEKGQNAQARNSMRALSDLDDLGDELDTQDCRDALEEYRDIDRADYGDYEEYQEARDEAWEFFLECLEAMVDEAEELVAQEEELEAEEKETDRQESVSPAESIKRIAAKYGWWATRLAESVCPYNDLNCIEKEAGRLTQALQR